MKHFVSLTKYAYGIALLVVFIILACIIFKDYGVSWDEKEQREIGYVTYNHVLKGENELFNSSDKSHGVAFELTLIFVEKALHLTDAWDVAYSRHLVTHLLFLLGCFCGYILIYRLFNNNVLACIGFLILVVL